MFENLRRAEPRLDGVLAEIKYMSYYRMRVLPFAPHRPRPPPPSEYSDDSVDGYVSPSKLDEGVGLDTYPELSSVPNSDELPADEANGNRAKQYEYDSDPEPSPEFIYLSERQARRRDAEFLCEVEEAIAALECSYGCTFDEMMKGGYSILEAFLEDVKMAKDRIKRELLVLEEKRQERGWLFLDTRRWPDAYRPEVGYEPTVTEGSDESDDEKLIDGLYVRGT